MRTCGGYWILVAAVAALGIWLRVSPACDGPQGAGYDERQYRMYVNDLRRVGPAGYPSLAQTFLAVESSMTHKIVPPLRATFIVGGWAWASVFGGDGFPAMQRVSCAFGILTLVVSFGFAWRLGGRWPALALLALMSVAPLQAYMCHRALIDGFFSFWSTLGLWLLWECLQAPADRRPATVLALVLAGLTMTKETAAFAVAAMAVILATARWTGIGRAGIPAWTAMVVGPTLGLLGLVALCGGIGPFREVLQVDLYKPLAPFTIHYADGPWYGYLLALVVLSPALMLFALGGLVGAGLRERPGRCMIAFILLTYAPLAAIPYQIVARLGTMWDFPLCWLAWTQLGWLSATLQPRARAIAMGVGVTGLCLQQLAQFHHFFVRHAVYEPVTDTLLRAINVVK